MIVNNSPCLTLSLRPNIDNEFEPSFEPILNQFSTEVMSDSSEKVASNRLNEVKMNLDVNRFKTEPRSERSPKKIICSIELARIKNVGALLKPRLKRNHERNNLGNSITSLQTKLKKGKRKHSPRLSHPPNNDVSSDVLGSILQEMDKENAKSVRLRDNLTKKDGSNGDCKSENLVVVDRGLASPNTSPINWDFEEALINGR